MNTRMLGSASEDKGVNFLIDNGFEIIDRNFKCNIGEIDVIAIKNNIIRFIEIKYRKSNEFGSAAYAINEKKLQKIFKIAEYYIMTKHLSENAFSIDALLIDDFEINYIENIYGGM